MTGNGGQVKGVAAGTAVITCEIDGVTASCVVTVTDPSKPVASFSLQKEALTLAVKKTASLSPINVVPGDATNLDGAKWFTSNAGIVEFTGNPNAPGQIRAVKKGTAIITCQIGSVKVYCKVTVA